MFANLWSILNGTIINAATVVVGSGAGLSFGARLPDRYQRIVLNTLGLITIALGVDAAVLQFAETVSRFRDHVLGGQTYGARLAMVMIASLVVGGAAGTALRLQERVEAFGTWIHRRFGGGRGEGATKGPAGPAVDDDGRRFAEGFLTASVIFCVGPLTLLGCLRNGSAGDPSYLYIKAVLDGFCSLALAASLGGGVALSVLTILVFQGGLSLLAYAAADPLPEVSRNLMSAVGGVIMLGNALLILDIKRIPAADMLPAIFLPPALVVVSERIWPGLLLPGGAGF